MIHEAVQEPLPSTEVELSRERKAEQLSIRPELYQLAKKLFPHEARVIDIVQKRRSKEGAQQYTRNIALIHKAPIDTVETAYIQFGGASATAQSQAGVLEAMCHDARNPKMLGMAVESVANAEAQGPIAPTAVERAMVNVELILNQLEASPQMDKIFLSFRSLSGLESAHTTLLLNTILKKEDPESEKLAAKLGDRTVDIGGVFLFQGGGVYQQTLGEFAEGSKGILSKENEISQVFPNIRDFHRVLLALDEAKDKQDAGLTLQYEGLLRQMNELNPFMRLAILQSALQYTRRRLDKAFAAKDTAQVNKLAAEIDQVGTQIETQKNRIKNLSILGDQEKDQHLKEQLSAIEAELYTLYPPVNREAQKKVEELMKQRQTLLKPVIDVFLAADDTIPGVADRVTGDKRNEMVRLLATLLPHMNIIKRMPERLKTTLEQTGVPLFYIFSDRDATFPAEKAFNDLSLRLAEKSELVLLFGNHPHSTVKQANKPVAQALGSLMKRSEEMRDGTIKQNVGKRIVMNISLLN